MSKDRGTVFSHLDLQNSGKTYFSYDKKRFNSNWRECIPEGYRVQRIDPVILDSMSNKQEVIDYIQFAWTTIEQYLEKGLGYCAVDSKNFATMCISVFASENEREVGIKTIPDFERRGLAYVTACAYIEECMRNDLVPVWSCFSDNIKSIKLAEKLGYVKEAYHPIYFAKTGD